MSHDFKWLYAVRHVTLQASGPAWIGIAGLFKVRRAIQATREQRLDKQAYRVTKRQVGNVGILPGRRRHPECLGALQNQHHWSECDLNALM